VNGGLTNIALGFLKAVFAIALVIAVILAAFVWWFGVSDPIKTYRLHDISGRTQQEQLKVLAPFGENVVCEHLGKFVERDGKVALEFRINTDVDYDELGCIEAQAPAGFIFAEVAD
jgi:hypothetical protein